MVFYNISKHSGGFAALSLLLFTFLFSPTSFANPLCALLHLKIETRNNARELLDLADNNQRPPFFQASRVTARTVKFYSSSVERKLRDARAAVIDLEAQIALPNKERRDKDPRWWGARLRKPENNPVTTRLKAELEAARETIAVNEKAELLISKVAALESAYAAKTEKEPYDELSYQWLLTQADKILNSKDNSETFKQDAEVQAQWFVLLTTHLSGETGRTNPVLRKLLEHARDATLEVANKWTERHMSRTIKRPFLLGLLNLALRTEKEWRTVLETFNEIDQIAEKGAEHRKEGSGIYDQHIVNLTQTALMRSLTPQQIMDRFWKIDRLGQETKEDFSIHDRNVVILVDISFELNRKPKPLVERFFEIIELAPATRSSWTFNHASTVAMTRASFRLNLDAKDLSDRLFEIYDLIEAVPEAGFQINDLGAALLAVASFEINQSAKETADHFMNLRRSLKGRDLPKYSHENLSRIAFYAIDRRLETDSFTTLLEKIHEQDGGPSLSPTRIVMIVDQLIPASVLQTPEARHRLDPTVEQISAALILPRFYQWVEARDHLVDSVPSSGSSSSSSSYSYSSSSSNYDDFMSGTPGIGDLMGTGIPGGIDLNFGTPF